MSNAEQSSESAPRALASLPEEVQLVIEDPTSLELRDDAAQLVVELPVQSFVTVARKLRDENRLDLALPHATAEQIVGLFDLDGWDRDRLAIPRAREWLDRIVDAYRESGAERGRLVDLLHDTDAEMWVLANAAATAVAELEDPDDDEYRARVFEEMAALHTWESPDGFFIIGVPDTELGHQTRRVIEAVYTDSLTEGRKLVSAIKWSLHAELEEELLRWRQGRLADLGFPEWEEAMRLFAPLAREAVLGAGDPEVERTPPAEGPSLPPQLTGSERDLLRRVMRHLDDDEYDLRLREFLLLVNELMAAQRFEPGDEALQERALGQAQGTLNLAFELLLASANLDAVSPRGEDVDAAADLDFLAGRVRAVGLRQLFRFGYGPLAKLRKAALALHRSGQVSLDAIGSLLDRPWGPALATLSRWYPELPLDGKAGSRPLRGRADLARATALIGEAGALAALSFAPQGCAVDPVWLNRVDVPAQIRLGDLVRTALIHAQLPGSSTAEGLRPLAPQDLLWAHENLLDERGRMVARVTEDLQARLDAMGVGPRGPALAEVLLPRLAAELAGLEDRGDGLPDLTKVGGLLTIQHVGVWLKTRAG